MKIIFILSIIILFYYNQTFIIGKNLSITNKKIIKINDFRLKNNIENKKLNNNNLFLNILVSIFFYFLFMIKPVLAIETITYENFDNKFNHNELRIIKVNKNLLSAIVIDKYEQSYVLNLINNDIFLDNLFDKLLKKK